MSSRSGEKIAIGRVCRPHGLHGLLKVQLYNPASTIVQKCQELLIGESPETAQRYHITSLQTASKSLLVALKECDTIEAAECLRNQQIWADVAQLPKLADGEFYHFQLVGLRVINTKGQVVGKVTAVEENESADSLVVRGRDKTHLIPLISDAVKQIDVNAGEIYLTDMEGLLDYGF